MPAPLRSAAVLAILLLLLPEAGPAGVLPACTEDGIASYYGPGFHGRPTASGEIFDSAAMTAAHKTLPLGTQVEVQRHDDGAVIEVTINDRGPFIDGRIIDLSEGAAEALGMIEEGIVPVTVSIYLDDQTDPDVRVALVSMEGLPLRRPTLLRLGGLKTESLGGDRLCPVPPPAVESAPEPRQRSLMALSDLRP